MPRWLVQYHLSSYLALSTTSLRRVPTYDSGHLLANLSTDFRSLDAVPLVRTS